MDDFQPQPHLPLLDSMSGAPISFPTFHFDARSAKKTPPRRLMGMPTPPPPPPPPLGWRPPPSGVLAAAQQSGNPPVPPPSSGSTVISCSTGPLQPSTQQQPPAQPPAPALAKSKKQKKQKKAKAEPPQQQIVKTPSQQHPMRSMPPHQALNKKAPAGPQQKTQQQRPQGRPGEKPSMRQSRARKYSPYNKHQMETAPSNPVQPPAEWAGNAAASSSVGADCAREPSPQKSIHGSQHSNKKPHEPPLPETPRHALLSLKDQAALVAERAAVRAAQLREAAEAAAQEARKVQTSYLARRAARRADRVQQAADRAAREASQKEQLVDVTRQMAELLRHVEPQQQGLVGGSEAELRRTMRGMRQRVIKELELEDMARGLEEAEWERQAGRREARQEAVVMRRTERRGKNRRQLGAV